MIARKRPTEPEEPEEPDNEKSVAGGAAPVPETLPPGQPASEGEDEPIPQVAIVKNRNDMRFLNRFKDLLKNLNGDYMDKVVDSLTGILDHPENQKMTLGACKVLSHIHATNVSVVQAAIESETEKSSVNEQHLHLHGTINQPIDRQRIELLGMLNSERQSRGVIENPSTLNGGGGK